MKATRVTRGVRIAWIAWIAAGLIVPGCSDQGPSVAVDREPPRLVSMAPADGATGVPVASVVRALFSEPVVIDSLGPPPIRVEGPGGLVPGGTALDPSGMIVIFTPADSLAVGSDYRAVVAAGIADRAGNVLADSTAARFTTALDFYAIGRLFTANANTFDVSVLDILTYDPVAGSPLALGVRPLRLAAVAEWGEMFLLYASGLATGVLVLDGGSLAVLRDSGAAFPLDATDLAVNVRESQLIVSVPSANALFVHDARTMGELAPPLVFDRVGSNPVRLAIAERFHWLLVGLEGGSRLGAYALPEIEAVPGFPAPAVSRIHTVAVDETRARAWVGGSQRYAVVDLVNPARTVSFALPTMLACLPPRCEVRGWSMLLAPPYDRVYLLNRRDAIASVGLSNLDTASELDERVTGFQADFVQNPRTGEIVVVDAQSAVASLIRLDPWTLRETSLIPRPVGGGGVLDAAVLP